MAILCARSVTDRAPCLGRVPANRYDSVSARKSSRRSRRLAVAPAVQPSRPIASQEATMTKARLNSMLLASPDPERLHAWYAALGPEQESKTNGYRILTFGGFVLLIDRRDDV